MKLRVFKSRASSQFTSLLCYARIILSILFISLVQCNQLHAQLSFFYTQYMNNQAPYNGAASLLDKHGIMNLLVRKQWLGVEGAPASLVFNAHVPIKDIRASSGIRIIHDEFGVEKATGASAFFAKSIRTAEDSFLGVSLSAGVSYYRAGYSQLDPYDVKFKDDLNRTSPTTGFGLMWYKPETYYIGVSLPEIQLQKVAADSTGNGIFNRRTWFFSGGCLLPLNDELQLKPAAMVAYSSRAPLLADISATVYIKEQIGIGLAARSTKEAAAIISYFFPDNLMLGYSYQTEFAERKSAGPGKATHEISLSYRFGFFTRARFL